MQQVIFNFSNSVQKILAMQGETVKLQNNIDLIALTADSDNVISSWTVQGKQEDSYIDDFIQQELLPAFAANDFLGIKIIIKEGVEYNYTLSEIKTLNYLYNAYTVYDNDDVYTITIGIK